jgi:phosphomannomutase
MQIALFPRKLFNMFLNTKVPLSDSKNLNEGVEKINSKLPSPHRVLVRYSDTELKLRVFIEMPDQKMVDDAWEDGKNPSSIA